jgi:hypothetical protein
MPTLTYPPKTQDKQYGPAFPWIDTRGLPKLKAITQIIKAHRALQSSTGTFEFLAQPIALEFGANDVWVQKGGKRSWCYDDSPYWTDERSQEYLERQPLAAEREFCFAPGVDDQGDDPMKIGFKVHGRPNIESLKLELFCRGHAEPIWSKAWGGAWGKKDADIDALPGAQEGDEWTGSLPWSEVKVDPNVQIGGAAAFPDGVLTALRSPYQLRLVVSGCTAKDEPPDGDRYAFPLVAWTYVHVLVDSIAITAGEAKWLSADRPDIHPDFREKIVGTRAEKPGGGIDHGCEGQTLEEVRQRFDERADLKPVTIFGTVVRKDSATEDFSVYHERMWGDGPRIPLVATLKVRTCAGGATDVDVMKVCKGLKLLWDWSDDPAAETPRWRKATDTRDDRHIGDAARTNEYLAAAYEEGSRYLPPSFNCPIVAGGKHGNASKPVFLEQSPKGNGEGSLPFEVTRCQNRAWSALSVVDEAGKSGVVFQPSRFPGDVYRVRAYPFFDPAMDSEAPIDPTEVAHGYAGRFEVFRSVSLRHLVIGTINGLDVDAIARTYRERLRRQVNIDLRGGLVQLDGATYQELLVETLDRLRGDLDGNKALPSFSATVDHAVVVGPPTTEFMTIRSFTATALRFQQWVVDGRVRLQKEEGYPAFAEPHRAIKTDLKRIEGLVHTASGKTIAQLHLRYRPGETGFPTHTFLLAPPDVAPANGDQVTGLASKQAYALQLEPAKSCRTREVTYEATRDGSAVWVKFGGSDPVKLEFKKAKLALHRSTSLTDEHKTALRRALGAAAFGEGDRALSIRIRANQNSDGGARRVEKVVAFIDTLFDVEHVVIDRQKVAAAALDVLEYYKTKKTVKKYFYRFTAFGPTFVEAYLDRLALPHDSIVMLHAARASNISDFPEANDLGDPNYAETNRLLRDVYDPLKDTALGGSIPSYRADDLHSGYIQLLTPDPMGASTDRTKTQKTGESVVIHEVGHALFIPEHAPRKNGQQWENADGAVPEAHVSREHCIMSYDPATHQFCGVCMLKLRGWRYKRFDSTTGARVVKASIQAGSWDLAFADADAVSAELGLLARLQAMNLFNRPLALRDEVGLGRAAQFVECAAFSRAYANQLKPGLDLPANLRNELTKFICDASNPAGELFPAGTTRKLRITGGFMPLYNNADIELRCTNDDGDFPAAMVHPEEDLALDAPNGRDSIQARYLRDNPGLGVVPLAVTVKDPFGTGIPGLRVIVRLIEPGPPPAHEVAEVEVVGATSFNRTAGAPPAGPEATQFLAQHVDGVEPSADDCPIKQNAHHRVGGKREMVAGGDVTSRGPNGERNLFVPPPGSGLEQFARPQQRGAPIPWAVELETGPTGVAELLFCPAPIGGDRYRLQVQVMDPDGADLAVYETGDIVVWRTARVSRHLQMPNVTQLKELGASMQSFIKEHVQDSDKVKSPLDPLDVKVLALELARAYVDCLVDPAAKQPEAFARPHWDAFMDALGAAFQRYPLAVNTTAFVGGRRDAGLHRYEIQLKPDPTNKKRVFRGRFPGVVVPDTVYFGTGEVNPVAAASALSAFAHCHRGDEDVDEHALTVPLVALSANEPVCGTNDRTNGPVRAIDANILRSYVHLGTGEVQVTFTEDQTEPVKAGAHLRDVIDIHALLTFPARSPFLFTTRAPADYNKTIKGTGRAEIPPGQNKVERIIRDKPYGLTQGVMLRALHHSIGGNKQSYYPGLVIMHAMHLDPYTMAFDVGLGGKGIGNGVLLLNYPARDPEESLKLLVHEASHCLYMVHTGTVAGTQDAHRIRHDTPFKCVMSYEQAERSYCGKCLASLRGMPVSTPGALLTDTGVH